MPTNPPHPPSVEASDEAALLAYFYEEAEPSPVLSPSLPPVPLSRRRRKQGPEAETSPLSMTALQSLAELDTSRTSRFRMGALENRWLERRRHRRAERVMLNAAIYVASALIIGAFVFVQLEDSMASNREAAERKIGAAQAERQQQLQRDERTALSTARLALTQPRWTDLLSYIHQGRQLLPMVRDHYTLWSYAPFHDPELRVVDREITRGRLERVHVRLEGSKPWASTIIMQRDGNAFKLDWHSFQDRFREKGSPSYLGDDHHLHLRLEEESLFRDRYFSTLELGNAH